MKEIKLTQGKVAIVDEEDFEWLSQWNWFYYKNPKDQNGYARRNGCRKNGKPNRGVRMHREIMQAKPGQMIDHVNRDTLDNRRCNLRIVDKYESSWNKPAWSKKKQCSYKGVSATQDRMGIAKYWIARITIKGDRIYLGTFPNPELANEAYILAAKKYHGKHSYV